MFSLFGGGQEEVSHLSDVVLPQPLKDRVSTIANALTNTVKEGTYFRNMLFYGPPGTGKTMLAMTLAKTCGLEYIYFSAAKLEMYTIEEALRQLVTLFEYAKSYKNKLMIIADESDVLFADRDGKVSDKTRKLLNAFLTYTGTECSDYVVVALTNRFHVFDEASFSRFGIQLSY